MPRTGTTVALLIVASLFVVAPSGCTEMDGLPIPTSPTSDEARVELRFYGRYNLPALMASRPRTGDQTAVEVGLLGGAPGLLNLRRVVAGWPHSLN
jgi:hypothetical protein